MQKQKHNGYWIDTRQGVIDDQTEFHEWTLLRSFIGMDIYWHINAFGLEDMPPGHRAYIVKVEGSDLDWLTRQGKQLNAPIFVLNGCLYPGNFFHPSGPIHWLPWVELHYHAQTMLRNFAPKVTKQIEKKISSLVRISKPNKMVALATVKKYHGQDSITSLHDHRHWLDHMDNDVTGHMAFDALLEDINIFALGPEPNDDLELHTIDDVALQKKINDFHHAAYQSCAINVTNESFLQSDGWSGDRGFVYPGPYLTEKTVKCLVGETALIANGQFQTYRALQSLGFQFDYGLDLSYDEIQPDFDRLVGMAGLIKSLQSLDMMEIFQRTRASCLHNKQHILSGQFYEICEKINQTAVQSIHERI